MPEDRLGTNTGKTQKRDASSCSARAPRRGRRERPPLALRCEKRPLRRHFRTQKDRFAKTGSGRNIVGERKQHYKKEGVVCRDLHRLARRALRGAKNATSLRHLYTKCIILPRQTRDKHRENSKNEWRFLRSVVIEQHSTAFRASRVVLALLRGPRRSDGRSGDWWATTAVVPVRKTPLLCAISYQKVIIPRQARDKHRKS